MDISFLPWDTNLFNFNVGCINLTKITTEILNQIIKEANDKEFHLIYLFCRERPISNNMNCSSLFYAGQKITFIKEITQDHEVAQQIHKQISTTQFPDKLKDLAFLSGHCSRFRIDSNFKNNEFKNLYSQWIQKSVSHEIADEVFIYTLNHKIVGFVTLQIQSSICNIGLIAVDPIAQRQGVGHQLIIASEHYAFLNKCTKLTVATQNKNEQACAFYKINQFVIYNTQEIYHLWL